MTEENRLVQVTGQIDEEHEELILAPAYTDKSPDFSAIRHDFKTVRVSSIDTQTQRLECQAKRHYALNIVSRTSFRKLYFLTYDKMLSAMDLLLRVGQKFQSRADQYEVVETQSDTDTTVLNHQIVRHRKTREKFLMKVIPHDAPDYTSS